MNLFGRWTEATSNGNILLDIPKAKSKASNKTGKITRDSCGWLITYLPVLYKRGHTLFMELRSRTCYHRSQAPQLVKLSGNLINAARLCLQKNHYSTDSNLFLPDSYTELDYNTEYLKQACCTRSVDWRKPIAPIATWRMAKRFWMLRSNNEGSIVWRTAQNIFLVAISWDNLQFAGTTLWFVGKIIYIFICGKRCLTTSTGQILWTPPLSELIYLLVSFGVSLIFITK